MDSRLPFAGMVGARQVDYKQNLCARSMRIGVSTFRAVCQIIHGRGGDEEGGSGAASKGIIYLSTIRLNSFDSRKTSRRRQKCRILMNQNMIYAQKDPMPLK